MRDLTRTRTAITRERTRKAQRLEKVLEDAGIKLSVVATDITGISGRAILGAMVAGERDPVVLADLSVRQLRAKIPALTRALAGRFSAHHAFLVLQQRILIEGLVSGPSAQVGWGSFASAVVVADLGSGTVDLAPEDPAGLVQPVTDGLESVGEQSSDVADGGQQPPPGRGCRRLGLVGAEPFPRSAPSAGTSPESSPVSGSVGSLGCRRGSRARRVAANAWADMATTT